MKNEMPSRSANHMKPKQTTIKKYREKRRMKKRLKKEKIKAFPVWRKTLRYVRKGIGYTVLVGIVGGVGGAVWFWLRLLIDLWLIVAFWAIAALWMRRIKLRQVGEALCDTPLPLKRIAEDLGFASEAGLHRAFQQATGQTPLAYRMAHG